MLCSLIRQICCRRPNTPPSVEALKGYKEQGHRPDRTTLEQILVDTIHGFSQIFIVLDALDEYVRFSIISHQPHYLIWYIDVPLPVGENAMFQNIFSPILRSLWGIVICQRDSDGSYQMSKREP